MYRSLLKILFKFFVVLFSSLSFSFFSHGSVCSQILSSFQKRSHPPVRITSISDMPSEIQARIREKSENKTFADVMTEWKTFYNTYHRLASEIAELDPKKARELSLQIAALDNMATSHFKFFVNSNHPKKNQTMFQRIYTILKHLNQAKDQSLEVYLFILERQIRRFYSIREFRNCRS